MSSFVVALLHTLRTSFRTRAALEAEILALRHQLQVLQRARSRQLRLTRVDRVLWVWFWRPWSGWRTTIVVVKPATVIAWHRHGFRLFWTWNLDVVWAARVCRRNSDH
jgi:putative transposase